jgi:glycosyltransferase involved in cell wall biosynthesis
MPEITKKERILILARGEMNAVDVAFWEGVHNKLIGCDSDIMLLVHHKPQTPCSFRWKIIPNLLSEITLPDINSNWMQNRGSKVTNEREQELLKLEAAWRGQPQTTQRQRELELALFCAEDIMSEIVSNFQPNLVIIWNGLHAIEQILADIAKKHNCPLAWLERGPFPGTLQLDNQGILAASSPAKDNSWSWNPKKDQKHWIAIFNNLIKDYTNGASSWWPQPETIGIEATRAKLGINGSKQVVVFFGQVDEDSQNLFFAPNFSDNLAAWSWLTQELAAYDNLMVIGKHHPKSSRSANDYQQVTSDISNAKWVDDISVHDLMQVADLVAAVNSSTVFEALMSGLPAITLGNSLLSGKSIAYEIAPDNNCSNRLKQALQHSDIDQRLERFHDFGAYMLAKHLVTMQPEQEKFGINGRKTFAKRICALIEKETDYSQPPGYIPYEPGTKAAPHSLPPASFAPIHENNATKTVIFATFIPFWNESTGAEVRDSAFIRYLSQQPIDLHILFTGIVSSQDIKQFHANCPTVRLHATNTILPGLPGGKQIQSPRHAPSAKKLRPGIVQRGATAIAMHPPLDRLFDRRGMGLVYKSELRPIEMHCPETLRRSHQLLGKLNPAYFILQGLRHAFLHQLKDDFSHAQWIIDTIDIQHIRSKSMHKSGIANGVSITANEERRTLSEFNAVLAICNKEKQKLIKMLPGKTVLSATHAVITNPLPEPDSTTIRIGIVSTWSLKNIKALRWFIKNVWVDIHAGHNNTEFYIFGTACRTIGQDLPDGIVLKGEVENVSSAFPQFHIAINPIRSGAGLQIKSVEAISYGRPLVTTRLGAQDLIRPDGNGVLIANSASEWQAHLSKLITNRDFRLATAAECTKTAQQNFSNQAAFHEVIDFIKRDTA